MNIVLSKDELIEIENEVFELKLLIPLIGVLMYTSSLYFKFTKYPLSPFLYISIIYLFLLIFFHFVFRKFKSEKIFIYYYLFLSIIEIILTTILIYYTGGITSSLFVIYLIIVLSIAAYRIINISFIVGILSFISYIILVYGQFLVFLIILITFHQKMLK
ncbi:MAG: hypothetical protein QMD25_00215 [Caldisericia bacterium]|nr:hypothetical protein [Caldisericia bacterium]